MELTDDDIRRLSPCVLGELLRDLTFNQDGGKEVGCYSTFDLRRGWEPLSEVECVQILARSYGEIADQHEWEQSDWDERLNDFRAGAAYGKSFGDCRVRTAWYWDGDGTLAFDLGSRLIVNTDCKKDYEWEDAPAFSSQ